MNDGKNFFDQPINNDYKTYENIRKIATSQGDNYTTGCLLDYLYFNAFHYWRSKRKSNKLFTRNCKPFVNVP